MSSTRNPTDFSAADFLALVCALAMLSAFTLMPWVSILGVGANGARLLSDSRIPGVQDDLSALLPISPSDVGDRYIPALLLILIAAIGGSLAALWGVSDPRNRRIALALSSTSGLVGLIYYGRFFLQNSQTPVDVAGFAGAGFWIALFGALGLVLQAVIPRPKAEPSRLEAALAARMAQFLNIFGRTPLSRRKAYWGMALVAPNVLGLMFFFGLPVLVAFATSFNEWNAIKPATFVGLDNFETLLADDVFWKALGNTVKLAIFSIPAEVILALTVAVLLNRKLPGRGLFRTAYFLPVVTSVVASSVVWTLIFQTRYGLLGSLIPPFREMKWLTQPSLVLIPIAVVTVWLRIGFDMVLFLSGLQAIPQVLYEASTIDGAGRWQRFRRVTLPLLSPTTFLVITLSVINAFQIFDQVYIMTARTVLGGAQKSATTLPLYLYIKAFDKSQFGYASALALALFLIILALTVFQLWVQRLWVYYEAEEQAA